jgi:hypothetical protein
MNTATFDDALRKDPPRLVRSLYALACAASVVPLLVPASGWVALTFGGAGSPALLLLLVIPLLMWRAVAVIRSPARLARAPGSVLGALLCQVGVAAMTIGVLSAVAMLLPRLAARLAFGDVGSPNGIEFYVVAVYATLVQPLSWIGIGSYEIGRAVANRSANLGRETRRRVEYTSAAMIAAVPVCAVAGYLLAQRSYASFHASCEELGRVEVHGTIDGPISGVTLIYQPAQRLSDRVFSANATPLLVHPSIEFTERCLPDWCERATIGDRGIDYGVYRERTAAPTSSLRWTITSRVLEQRWGTKLFQLRHEVRDAESGRLLTSASERVFDWGRWDLVRSGSAARRQKIEACGYAAPSPVPYRETTTPPTPAEDAYMRADLRLIGSVLAEPRRAAFLARIPERISQFESRPWEPLRPADGAFGVQWGAPMHEVKRVYPDAREQGSGDRLWHFGLLRLGRFSLREAGVQFHFDQYGLSVIEVVASGRDSQTVRELIESELGAGEHSATAEAGAFRQRYQWSTGQGLVLEYATALEDPASAVADEPMTLRIDRPVWRQPVPAPSPSQEVRSVRRLPAGTEAEVRKRRSIDSGALQAGQTSTESSVVRPFPLGGNAGGAAPLPSSIETAVHLGSARPATSADADAWMEITRPPEPERGLDLRTGRKVIVPSRPRMKPPLYNAFTLQENFSSTGPWQGGGFVLFVPEGLRVPETLPADVTVYELGTGACRGPQCVPIR